MEKKKTIFRAEEQALPFPPPPTWLCRVGWVDIGTRTKVPLRFVTYLSKVSETDEKNVLKQ
jgi:hypothetical protein